MAGLKYALLLLPIVDDRHEASRQLTSEMTTWRGKLSEFIEKDRVDHWRGWMGSMQWDQLMDGSHRFVLASRPSNRQDDDDAESVELRSRLEMALSGLHLSDHNRLSRDSGHPVRVISGGAGLLSPPMLRTIKHFGPKPALPRPFYCRTTVYHRARAKVQSRKPQEDAWIDDWEATTSLIIDGFAKKLPTVIHIALIAYNTALTQGLIDFRIPLFVRAAECILGVPRPNPQKGIKGGRVEFARRSMKIAPSLQNHWFVGGKDIETRIHRLYEHRNECVHGMVPFPALYDKRKASAAKDAAVRIEYLAEAIARESILAALRDPKKFPEFGQRATLEDAWDKGRFP